MANTILERCKELEIKDVSPLKLQKLVYYAHAWHLAMLGRPLLADQIEAWPYGPVVAQLYHALKGNRAGNITEPLLDVTYADGKVVLRRNSTIPKTDAEAHALVGQVMDAYGNYTAIQLSNLSHSDDEPWAAVLAATGSKGSIPKGLVIPDEVIRQVFTNKLKKAKEGQRNG